MDTDRDEIAFVGDVVQIDPAHDTRFGSCFMVVTDVKEWGYIGYVEAPGDRDGVAYYRVPKNRCIRIGKAEWTLGEDI